MKSVIKSHSLSTQWGHKKLPPCLTTLTLVQNTRCTQCPHLLHLTHLMIIKETLLRISSGVNELQTQHTCKSVSVSDITFSVFINSSLGALWSGNTRSAWQRCWSLRWRYNGLFSFSVVLCLLLLVALMLYRIEQNRTYTLLNQHIRYFIESAPFKRCMSNMCKHKNANISMFFRRLIQTLHG